MANSLEKKKICKDKMGRYCIHIRVGTFKIY